MYITKYDGNILFVDIHVCCAMYAAEPDTEMILIVSLEY